MMVCGYYICCSKHWCVAAILVLDLYKWNKALLVTQILNGQSFCSQPPQQRGSMTHYRFMGKWYTVSIRREEAEETATTDITECDNSVCICLVRLNPYLLEKSADYRWGCVVRGQHWFGGRHRCWNLNNWFLQVCFTYNQETSSLVFSRYSLRPCNTFIQVTKPAVSCLFNASVVLSLARVGWRSPTYSISRRLI